MSSWWQVLHTAYRVLGSTPSDVCFLCVSPETSKKRPEFGWEISNLMHLNGRFVILKWFPQSNTCNLFRLVSYFPWDSPVLDPKEGCEVPSPLVALLLTHGANVHRCDARGKTPLMHVRDAKILDGCFWHPKKKVQRQGRVDMSQRKCWETPESWWNMTDWGDVPLLRLLKLLVGRCKKSIETLHQLRHSWTWNPMINRNIVHMNYLAWFGQAPLGEMHMTCHHFLLKGLKTFMSFVGRGMVTDKI